MTVTSLDTVFPADAVEFCPHPEALDIVVCGSYKLDDEPNVSSTSPAPQHRRGQCLVLQVDRADATAPYGVRQIHSIDLPAVLDMKWCHRSPSVSAILGIADSEGKVTLHEWQTEEKILKHVGDIQCASADTLCLSLGWSNRRTGGTRLGSLIASLSNGSLCLLSPSEASGLAVTGSWHAHDHEPWIAAWNDWDTNIIYSGGDDLKLKAWDIRQDQKQPIFTNKRFDAGVTSIQSNPHVEHLIAVGSYDNTVRLFDVRKPLLALAEVAVGGGAWRVKWHPSESRKEDLLVACMHDGVKVVHFGLGGEVIPGEVAKRFEAHESMAYGADWSYGGSLERETVIGSCSFYDHVFHLWSG
ncbi:putative WD40 repeat-like protein [Lyophyllum shimeji]|uniref:methylated diphthine methylhydrolase n=1 Tax=Lyophyllum shimeji TaxID=47721 RepID=A0A9P3UK02_LYOSH|nr:putative WD40 repeat-like protein [Lyophyllum shimeji]